MATLYRRPVPASGRVDHLADLARELLGRERLVEEVHARVEHRVADEVTSFAGTVVSPAGSSAYNPAFDVTPAELVTALVTERGMVRPASGGTLQFPGAAAPMGVAASAGRHVER